MTDFSRRGVGEESESSATQTLPSRSRRAKAYGNANGSAKSSADRSFSLVGGGPSRISSKSSLSSISLPGHGSISRPRLSPMASTDKINMLGASPRHQPLSSQSSLQSNVSVDSSVPPPLPKSLPPSLPPFSRLPLSSQSSVQSEGHAQDLVIQRLELALESASSFLNSPSVDTTDDPPSHPYANIGEKKFFKNSRYIFLLG